MNIREDNRFQRGRDIFSFFIMSFMNASRPLKPVNFMVISLTTGITALASMGLKEYVPHVIVLAVISILTWTVVYVFFQVFNAQNRFTQDYGQNFIGPTMALDKMLQAIQLGTLTASLTDKSEKEASLELLKLTFKGISAKRRGIDMTEIEENPDKMAEKIIDLVYD